MALWGAFRARLAEERSVISFDPRGVGESSDCHLFGTTRDMAGDALALLDAIHVERVHAFGLSLGGMVATWLAIDYPGRIEKLVLASTLPRPKRFGRGTMAELIGVAGCLSRPAPAAEICMVHGILSPDFLEKQPEAVRGIEAAIRTHPSTKANLLRLMLAGARHDPGVALEKIVAPTFILTGALDPIVGPAARAELKSRLPLARIEVLPDAGHDLTLEQPLATALEVSAFLHGRVP